MARVKTFAIGGTVTPTDLNSIQDAYELLYSLKSQGVVPSVRSGISTGETSGVKILQGMGHGGASMSVAGASGPDAGETIFPIDPADFTVPNRTVKFRTRAQLITNSVAPTGTITFGLYPVASLTTEAALQRPVVNSLSAVVSGSTAAFASPAASSQLTAESGDFDIASAGFYVMAANFSGSTAAGATLALVAELKMRWI